MDFNSLALNLPDFIYREFERALESGVWSNGVPMTSQQMDICKEALAQRYGKMRRTLH